MPTDRQLNAISILKTLPAYSGWADDDISTNISEVLSSGDANRISKLSNAVSGIENYSGWQPNEITDNLKDVFGKRPSLIERAKEGIGAGVEKAKAGISAGVEAARELVSPPYEQAAARIEESPREAPAQIPVEQQELPLSTGITREFGAPEKPQEPVSEEDRFKIKSEPAVQEQTATITDPLLGEKYRAVAEAETPLEAGAKEAALALTYTKSPVSQYRKEEHPVAATVGEIAGTVAPMFAGGTGVIKTMASVPKLANIAKAGKLGQVAFNGLGRMTTSAIDYIARHNEELVSEDDKVKADAKKNLAINLAASVASPLPETFLPKNLIQPVAQGATDLIVEVIGQKIAGSDAFNEENFVNTIASAVAGGLFGIADIKGVDANTKAVVKEVKKNIEAPPKTEKDWPEFMARMLKEAESYSPGRKPVFETGEKEFKRTKKIKQGEVEVDVPSGIELMAAKRPPPTEADIELAKKVDIDDDKGYIKEYEQPSEPQPQPMGPGGKRRTGPIPPYGEQQPGGEAAGEGAVPRVAGQAYPHMVPSPELTTASSRISQLKEKELFETAMVPEGIGERGSVNLSVAKNAKNELGKLMQEQLTTRGGLPKEVFRRKMQKEHWINAELKEIENTVSEFKSKATKAYGKSRLSSQEAFELDAALKGEKSIEEIKPELQPIIKNMRNHIDALSQKMIDEGVIEGDLVGKFTEDMGFYANRSYRVFDDPDWAKKVPEDVRNRAKAFIRDEYPDLSEAEVNGRIDELLYKEEAPIALLAKGKLGSKKLGILKHRKEIPAEIRALWGEYKDADVNYAQSVSKMASLIANHKFLNDVKAEGLGKYFHEKPIVQRGESYSVPISGEETPSMKPLSGLYTTKEIKDAFEKTMSSSVDPAWLRGLIGVSSTAKYAKTILSPMTHLRNVMGNTGFAIMNGHVDVTKAPKAIAMTFRDFANKGTIEQKRYLRELTELGVIGTGARYGEIRDIVKDVTQGDIDIMIGTGKRRAAKKAIKGIEKLYGAEDDVWKVYAFENELQRYKKALPNMSDKEIKEHVANIVRNTYPTYEMIPELVKKVRKFPFVGSFVSFPAEVIRTSANTVKLAMDELKTPELRTIGAQRLAGILTAATITGAATAGARYLTGTNRKKDEAYRTFMGPWSQNSQIIYIGKGKEGEQNYIDLGYTDPHSYIKNVVIAAMRGEDIDQKAMEALGEAFSPFLSEDLMTQKLLDISRNKKKDGTQVWNTEDNLEGKMTKAAAHFADAITPGAIVGAKRMYHATKEGAGKYGQKYDLKTEAIAQSTGVRVSRLNVARSLKYKTFQLRRDLTEAARLKYKGERISEREKMREDKIVSKLRKRFLLTGDLKSTEDTLKSHNISQGRIFSEIQRQKILNKYIDTIRDAMVAGLSSEQIFNILKDSGVPKKDAAIMVYQRMSPEETTERE